jgi:hypothetical protein
MTERTEIVGREPARAAKFCRVLSGAHESWLPREVGLSKWSCVTAVIDLGQITVTSISGQLVRNLIAALASSVNKLMHQFDKLMR